jgi:hypothetical protein
MATLAQKIRAEQKMRALIEQSELPEPDEVEYGHGCIRLLWYEQKVCVVVDIDESARSGLEFTEEALDEHSGDDEDEEVRSMN